MESEVGGEMEQENRTEVGETGVEAVIHKKAVDRGDIVDLVSLQAVEHCPGVLDLPQEFVAENLR